ncbi:MAG: HAD family hydrolase [Solirubrobacterales bacterium]
MLNLASYNTIILDCDGIILDSNSIKTDAFYEVALVYGQEAARSLAAYHKQNGGISRYLKFQYFFREILGKDQADREIQAAIDHYGELVRARLATCNLTEGLLAFLDSIPDHIPKYVVSGGNEAEVREALQQQGLGRYFRDIWGSPATKDEIFGREIDTRTLVPPMLYIGDSIYDYECASRYGMGFIFVYQYTEVQNWQDFFENKSVTVYQNLAEAANNIVF